MYLARGAAEAVTRWADAVTQLAGFLICHTGALPIQTHFGVASALSSQKLDQFAVVDALIILFQINKSPHLHCRPAFATFSLLLLFIHDH